MRKLFGSHLLVRLVLLIALAFSVGRVVAATTFHLRSVDLSVRLAPDLPGGSTVLHLGPFGVLAWRTHKTPVNVEATFVLRPEVKTLPTIGELRDVRVTFLLRRMAWLVLCGLLAGALLAEGMGRRTLLAVGLGGAGAVVAGGGLVLASVLTFDASALAHPRYRGPIQGAPRVLQLLKEAQANFSGVQRNINRAVEGLERIHEQIVASSPPEIGSDEGTRFLVVSDLHNNPLGLLIAKELVERFKVDAVLDGGDITDRGTRLEGELFARFAQLGIPHVVVAGNHEDQAALGRIAAVRGVRILSAAGTETTDVNGILILGDADPNSTTIGDDPFSPRALEQIPALCSRLAERWADVQPDILLVHDPRIGECAARLAQERQTALVFVWGHLHRPAYEERGSVTSVSPGTSGSNGIKSDKEAPYGFALLEFDRTHTLRSACEFLFAGPGELQEASCDVAPTRGAR